MSDSVLISETGFDKLTETLSKLEKEQAEVRIRVGDAREQGDLKENGDYIYGRQQLGFIEGKLAELRTKINQSEKVDCTKVQCDKALFGTVVTLLDLDSQETIIYQLLGINDANYSSGSISLSSPVGSAIVGLSVGEQSSVTIPRGEFRFEIVDISQSKIK